jgi:hypothetical protein
LPVSETVGKKSAVATPMRAVSAARVCSASRQHRQFEELSALLALERGDDSPGLVVGCGGGGDIEVGAGAEIAHAAGQVQGLLGDVGALAGGVGLRGEGARVGVGPRGPGGDGDAHDVLGFGGGGGVGAGGLDRAADAAEDVDLVTDVERAGAEPGRLGLRPAQCLDQLRAARAAPHVGHREVGRREQPGAGLGQHARGLQQVGGGDLEVLVLAQRLLNQAVERRVVIEPPPVGRRRIGRGDGRRGGHERRACPGRGLGRAVVRPHRAGRGGQHQRK